MNAELQFQLDRVEAALNTLVDSITSYNPNPAAALALVSVDDELCRGLNKLARHQANVATLYSLRESTASLDTTIKSTLGLLADTRKDLMTRTPTTLPDPSAHDVDYKELLNYAQRIAKNSIPPTIRPEMPPALSEPLPGPNDIATPPSQLPAPNGASSTLETSNAESSDPTNASKDHHKGMDSLTDEQKAWFDPHSMPNGPPFLPWPSEQTIRSGALARIQDALERGEDPVRTNIAATGAPALVSESDAAAKDAEKAQKAKEQREAAAAAARAKADDVRRRQAQLSNPREEEEDEGFGDLDLYDPDAD